MSKKVLLVEQSLAVRGIAESLLRQNGYEVVAADSEQAARQILDGSSFDLFIVATDIGENTERPFYKSLGDDEATATVPLLLLHDSSSGADVAYPPETIISKPFTPRDFLQSVMRFDSGTEEGVSPEQTPFGNGELEDDIIDAALGLDKIEVNGAEVMGNDTGSIRRQGKKPITESMIGFDYKSNGEDTAKTSRRLVSEINVPADGKTPGPATKQEASGDDKTDFLGEDSSGLKIRPVDQLSESSKIEIVSDQYGMIEPSAIDPPKTEAKKDDVHDYEWFLSEMKQDGQAGRGRSNRADESGSLQLASNADALSPSAPPPASESTAGAPKNTSEKSVGESTTHSDAVDKFITEFKKEMEKLSADDPASAIAVTNIAPSETHEPEAASSQGDVPLKWEENLENVSPAEIRVFSKELAEVVASRIARELIARMDMDAVYQILRTAVDETLERLTASKR